jgi:hypothetical protein
MLRGRRFGASAEALAWLRIAVPGRAIALEHGLLRTASGSSCSGDGSSKKPAPAASAGAGGREGRRIPSRSISLNEEAIRRLPMARKGGSQIDLDAAAAAAAVSAAAAAAGGEEEERPPEPDPTPISPVAAVAAADAARRRLKRGMGALGSGTFHLLGRRPGSGPGALLARTSSAQPGGAGGPESWAPPFTVE